IRFFSRDFKGKPVSPAQWNRLQERLLGYYANNGYPFAKAYPDSIRIIDDKLQMHLIVQKGIYYPIDSIRILGKAKLNTHFLQRYLGIPNGSPYSQDRLDDVDRKLKELTYVRTIQPANLTMLGTGAVLNLYLDPKKSSQVNFLLGFLPASGNEKKFQVTGDVNLDLKNMLGSGETILIKWQQLQVKSPRLNLGYNHPFIFNSAFGFDFLFDLFKKDSSYLQLNAQLGADYLIGQNQSARIFVQWQSSSLLEGGIDTNQIKLSKTLPPNIDVKSTNIGLRYVLQKTNYLYNPRKGTEVHISATVGTKNISRNNDIVNLKDPGFDYGTLYDSLKLRVYQLRARVWGSQYFPLGKYSTIRAGFQGGFYSSPSVFRNDLFQVGGSQTLRGFDEESIYASQFAVVTAEYRNLLSLNSYLFFFSDLGITQTKYRQVNASNRFLGLGLGLVYETKLGLLNITYAMGMRNDVPFNIRGASKLHFGYVNYF
ncbi:MAG: BamA/TamA family outer membrane protein, partial [Chitinophagaceae bacterium]|nr:BamA/TamA family outer membrane protein [Chitinophagaceae bacterium]